MSGMAPVALRVKFKPHNWPPTLPCTSWPSALGLLYSDPYTVGQPSTHYSFFMEQNLPLHSLHLPLSNPYHASSQAKSLGLSITPSSVRKVFLEFPGLDDVPLSWDPTDPCDYITPIRYSDNAYGLVYRPLNLGKSCLPCILKAFFSA